MSQPRANPLPPSADDVLDAVADIVAAVQTFVDTLHRFRYRPRTAFIYINGERNGMPLNLPDDQRADAAISFSDAFGDNVPEPGPVNWSVDNQALASVTPAPNDDTRAVVQVLAGSGTFHVLADSGNLHGTSDDLVITPGAATVGSINVVLEPNNPPAPTPPAP